MLLLRYFLSVGSVLLGLLFWVNWYFPPPVGEPSAPGIDRSIIRIHSAQRWPAAVPIDTSVPMPNVAPPPAVVADSQPAARPDPTPREAVAYAPPAAPKASNKIRRRARPASRFAARETHRRLASSQTTNWFSAMW
jgi:hypothetical protein